MHKRRSFDRHDCRLTGWETERELPQTSPFATATVKCRSYFLINWMTASRTNARSYQYLRSSYALYDERRRQLKKRRFHRVIHPLSKLAFVHHLLAATAWLLIFFSDPLIHTFLSETITTRAELQSVQVILNLFFCVDIFLNFVEGYVDPRSEAIILDSRSIIRRYLSSYFVFDLVPTVHTFLHYTMRATSYDHKILTVLPLTCLRFARLTTMLRYFKETMAYYRFPESVIKCVAIAIVQMMMIHWWTCLFYFSPILFHDLDLPMSDSWVLRSTVGTDRSIQSIYTECLLCITCHFFGAGTGNMNTRNPLEQLILSAILINGCMNKIYVIAIILQLFGTLKISEIKYEQFVFQLNEYMMTKKFPKQLRDRLQVYYEHRFQKLFFNEPMILSTLSEHLRNEVLLFRCKHLVDKMELLKGAPKEVIGAVIACLQHEIYLTGDVIIKADGYNEFVYFISYGTVALYLPNGKEFMHMEDGNHFGDVSTKRKFQVTATAVETTEVFYINARHFNEILSEYPIMMERLTIWTEHTLAVFRSAMEEDSDVLNTGDILNELKKGRILEVRRYRPRSQFHSTRRKESR